MTQGYSEASVKFAAFMDQLSKAENGVLPLDQIPDPIAEKFSDDQAALINAYKFLMGFRGGKKPFNEDELSQIKKAADPHRLERTVALAASAFCKISGFQKRFVIKGEKIDLDLNLHDILIYCALKNKKIEPRFDNDFAIIPVENYKPEPEQGVDPWTALGMQPLSETAPESEARSIAEAATANPAAAAIGATEADLAEVKSTSEDTLSDEPESSFSASEGVGNLPSDQDSLATAPDAMDSVPAVPARADDLPSDQDGSEPAADPADAAPPSQGKAVFIKANLLTFIPDKYLSLPTLTPKNVLGVSGIALLTAFVASAFAAFALPALKVSVNLNLVLPITISAAILVTGFVAWAAKELRDHYKMKKYEKLPQNYTLELEDALTEAQLTMLNRIKDTHNADTSDIWDDIKVGTYDLTPLVNLMHQCPSMEEDLKRAVPALKRAIPAPAKKT